MVWMPSLVARVEVLTWLWRVCQRLSRHMDRMQRWWNARSTRPYHLRGEAPVLGAVEQYRKDQATVYTALDLRCDVSSSEEAVLERTEGLTGL